MTVVTVVDKVVATPTWILKGRALSLLGGCGVVALAKSREMS